MYLNSKPSLFGVPGLLILYSKVHACNYLSIHEIVDQIDKHFNNN